MPKPLLKKLGLGALVIACVLYLVATFSGSFVESAIETFGPKILGVRVEVGEVFLLPFSGQASIRGLRVHNLPGYKEKYLFEVGSISASLDLKSLMTDTIVLRSVIIKAPTIAWEGSISESNVTQLQKNVMGQGASKEGASQKILIELLKLENAKANVYLGKAEPMLIALPPMTLTKVHSDRKADAISKVVAAVFAEISRKVVGEIAKHPEVFGKAVGDAVGGVLDGVKGLFGK